MTAATLWTPEELDPLARLLHEGHNPNTTHDLSTYEGRAAWRRVWDDRLRRPPKSRRKRKRRPSVARPKVSPLWTVKEVAAYLQRSERWVYTALKRDPKHKGSLPNFRLPGGGPRFDPKEVREWLADGCPPAAEFRRRQGGQL